MKSMSKPPPSSKIPPSVLMNREDIVWYNTNKEIIHLEEWEETVIISLRRLGKVVNISELSHSTIMSILSPTTADKRFYEFLRMILSNEDRFQKLDKINLDRFEISTIALKTNEQFAQQNIIEGLNYLFLLYRKIKER